MKFSLSSYRFAWNSRRAWWFTASAKTKDRFARTKLGSFWLGLSNLISIAILASIYGTVFEVPDFNSYVVYLGLGLVIWNTMASAIISAPNILKNNEGNIKNTATNPIFYTLEEWAFQLQSFIQSFSLVILCLSIFQNDLVLKLCTAGFIPIINLIAFIYWVPIMICIGGAVYEDLYQLVPIVTQLVFLLSPILYAKEALGEYSWSTNFNLFYIVLAGIRDSLMGSRLDFTINLIIALINIVGIIISVAMLDDKRKDLPFLL